MAWMTRRGQGQLGRGEGMGPQLGPDQFHAAGFDLAGAGVGKISVHGKTFLPEKGLYRPLPSIIR